MAGVNSNELESILQFIYQGETQVVEHDIKRFLKKAKQMEIQGLTVWNNGVGIGSIINTKKPGLLSEHVHDLDTEPILAPECLLDEKDEEIHMNYSVNIKDEPTEKTDQVTGENIEFELEGFPQEAEVEHNGIRDDMVDNLEGHLQDKYKDDGISENNENRKVRHSFDKLPVDNDIVKEDGVYLCKLCGKTNRKLFNIRKHYEIHHQRQWTSDNGIRENTENRKVRNIHRLGELLGDDDIVKEDGEFLCRLCGKTKRRLSNIRKHIYIHCQGQTYPCNFCEKCYKSKDSLKVHISKAHKNEDQ